jgi:sec-independent protein translocase protein TatA
MGLGGISPGSLLLIFFIVLILFGTKKLRSIGEDLGQAVRSFRKALNQEEPWYPVTQAKQSPEFKENDPLANAAEAPQAPFIAAKAEHTDRSSV